MIPNKDSIEFGNKLLKLRSSRGLSQSDVAKSLGIGQTTYAGYENGNRNATVSVINRFASYFNVNPDYLLGANTANNFTIPNKYFSLNPNNRAIADRIFNEAVNVLYEQQLSKQQATASQQTTANIIPFRLSEQPASAGYGYDLGPENFSIIHVRDDGIIDPKTMYGVPITGDSMEPKYHDGDIVIIKQNVDVPFGEIGLFTVGTCGYVKKRAVGKLLSLNPKYDPIPTPDDEYFACNGKVIDVLNPNSIVSE